MGGNGKKYKFSVKTAHEAQLRLSKQIIFEDKLPERVRFVGGVDVAYVKDISIGVAAVLDFDSLELVESQVASCKTLFPYIPTLLSFRETPPAVLCTGKLHIQPDVLLADGHGFAHPYRCGFASHLGLVLRRPTIGVAKSKLVGEIESVKVKEDTAFIMHNGELVGAAVTTKRACKPVYVSVGHMVTLKTAIQIVKHCVSNNRIPEPILRAHEIATEQKRKINILPPAKTGTK